MPCLTMADMYSDYIYIMCVFQLISKYYILSTYALFVQVPAATNISYAIQYIYISLINLYELYFVN